MCGIALRRDRLSGWLLFASNVQKQKTADFGSKTAVLYQDLYHSKKLVKILVKNFFNMFSYLSRIEDPPPKGEVYPYKTGENNKKQPILAVKWLFCAKICTIQKSWLKSWLKKFLICFRSVTGKRSNLLSCSSGFEPRRERHCDRGKHPRPHCFFNL